MKTTLNLPDDIINEAVRVMSMPTKTQAIILSLTEAIARRKSKKILELKGTMKSDYNYKKLRKKRS